MIDNYRIKRAMEKCDAVLAKMREYESRFTPMTITEWTKAGQPDVTPDYHAMRAYESNCREYSRLCEILHMTIKEELDKEQNNG